MKYAAPSYLALCLMVVAAFGDASEIRKIPAPGDWIEYRIAFPVDPLEDAIRDTLGEAADNATGGMTNGEPRDMRALGYDAGFSPNFRPKQRWTVMPLRLEIKAVREGGLDVLASYPGFAHESFLPLDRSALPLPFVPGGDDALAGHASANPDAVVEKDFTRLLHAVGSRKYPVSLERCDDPGNGFVRLVSDDLPFGMARFASPHCDLALVAMGSFPAPEFPVSGVVIEPPPGEFFDPRQ
ncbi:MAG: hypothetical protein LBJ46_03785 [Planctomycetota bacterium]|jgi:hypothetical protein|nr:hypothetical protein [Planctomycetota bacterium]